MLERLSARQIEEWILFETIEAEDERKAYEDAKRGHPTPPTNDED